MEPEQNRLHEVLQDGYPLQRRVEPCRLGDQDAELIGAARRRIGGVGQECEVSLGLVEVDFPPATGAPMTVYVSGLFQSENFGAMLVPVMTLSLTLMSSV